MGGFNSSDVDLIREELRDVIVGEVDGKPAREDFRGEIGPVAEIARLLTVGDERFRLADFEN
jgi:hypothetical protein